MVGSILGNGDRGCLYPASQGALLGQVATVGLPIPRRDRCFVTH